MDTRDITGLALCVCLWVPIAAGLWHYRERESRATKVWMQAYGCVCVVLGLWIGLAWFRPYFALVGQPRHWLLAAVPGGGLLLLIQVIMPGRLRNPKTWQETAQKAPHFIVVVGLLEEIWFRGIWFACFDGSFVGSVLLGSIAFGLAHLAHYLPDVRKGRADAFVSAIMGFCFGCARYNGAGVLMLGVSHGVLDLFFHHLLVEKEQRFGGIVTIALGLLGCLALAGVTFLW